MVNLLISGSLFHRAILMSGSSLSPWALVKDPIRYTKLVTDHVNCSLDASQTQLLKCLRSRPLDTFLKVPIDIPEFTNAFGPSIDGVVIDTNLAEFTSSTVDGMYTYQFYVPKLISKVVLVFDELSTCGLFSSRRSFKTG